MSGKRKPGILVRISHMRLLMPCLLVTIMVLDGLLGYTMPDPFNGIETVTQQAYAAEVPELEELAQTAERQVSKGPAGKLPAADESGEYNDGEYTGSARGFGGTITVRVTIRGGKIVAIKVLSASGETGSYFARASKVISRIINKQSTNVDAVSGATYSSNGIIKAVRNALAKAARKKSKKNKEDKDKPAKEKPRKAVKPSTITGGTWRDGTYIGEGEGFGGKLHVKVAIEDGRITSIELVDNLDGEDFMNRARTAIFPAVLQKQGTDVDSVTGATFSSYGLIEAINDALRKAADAGSTQDADTGSGDDAGGEDTGESGGAGGSGTDSGGTGDKAYKDGSYSVTAVCTRSGWFDYDINISLTVSDGRITSISMYKGDDWTEDEEDREENDEYLNMAVNGYGSRKGMISRILDAQSADVDTVTGATYSSNAIRSSVQGLLADIETVRDDETDAEDKAASADNKTAAKSAAAAGRASADTSDDPGIGAAAQDTDDGGAADNPEDNSAPPDEVSSGETDNGGGQEAAEAGAADSDAESAADKDKKTEEQPEKPEPASGEEDKDDTETD